jgi:phosphoribosylanthranilate isomerase
VKAVSFVKICGITRAEDAQAAVEYGANAVGFIFWPQSPRCVDASLARDIVATLPGDVTAVGVFVNQPADEVNRIAHQVELGAVQLHGDEGADYVRVMSRPVIKAVALGAAMAVGANSVGFAGWLDTVRILLDVHDPVKRGGTGRTIDWTLAAEIARQRDIVLAGGLTPDNISEAISRVQPFGVDVSSGVEARPGIKDHGRLKALFEAIHGSHYATRS